MCTFSCDVGVGDRQERQVERREHRQLLGMVRGADVGHLEAADLQQVEQFLGLAEALVADLDLELAAGALVHELLELLDVGGAARGLPQAASSISPRVRRRSCSGRTHSLIPQPRAATRAATTMPARRLMNASWVSSGTSCSSCSLSCRQISVAMASGKPLKSGFAGFRSRGRRDAWLWPQTAIEHCTKNAWASDRGDQRGLDREVMSCDEGGAAPANRASNGRTRGGPSCIIPPVNPPKDRLTEDQGRHDGTGAGDPSNRPDGGPRLDYGSNSWLELLQVEGITAPGTP